MNHSTGFSQESQLYTCTKLINQLIADLCETPIESKQVVFERNENLMDEDDDDEKEDNRPRQQPPY